MRKINIITIGGKSAPRPLVSSKRDGRERNICFKGLFEDRPNKLSHCSLSADENQKFEKGEAARVKGGLYKVQQYPLKEQKIEIIKNKQSDISKGMNENNKQITDLALNENELHQKMVNYLAPLYFPDSLNEDDINELASKEFCRVRGIICREYKFDEDKYIEENNGTSPFDFVRDDVEHEVYARIRKDMDYIGLTEMRERYIQIIRSAVEKQNNIIGTFYQNKGIHFRHDQEALEYETSPIVVIHNSTFFNYGGYEANTVYELFIDAKGLLFCTLNGEDNENFNEPIEHVQTEGLVEITHWLAEQGFINYPQIQEYD